MPAPSPSLSSLSPLKRAFLAIEDLQARLAASENARHELIAIVGLGCRFPGDANTPAEFWELLAKGVDAVTEVPATRWPVDAFFDADPSAAGRMSARHGGFLRDIEGFDAAYFGISPREAASMDPQHRLLLEVAWEALSAAGQRHERLAGSATGVFVGITTAEYSQLQLAADGLGGLDTYHITGNALNAAAGRLAFVFGLHGPCMAVDTACSSSLVALHLACQSLRAGECETALAGGVNLILSPIGSIALSKGRVLSADGRAKTFDAAADGMVRGEGCGLLVLKRLSAAQRDGDRVLAVIQGSGVNQDGPSSGLTVPNGPAQEMLLRHVLTSAQIDPAAVDYIEAHGTGTALGDPIEVGALGAVYGSGRQAEHPLWIGSVKTNVGHLESAAGIAGVIKAVLALHHEAIPAHLHFKHPSPHIDWKNLPLRVPTALTPWPRGDRPRYAGVSAFGFSGTNAHVILGEAPASALAKDDPRGFVAPASPFRREKFPLPRPASYGGARVAAGAHPLVGAELSLAGTNERRWEVALPLGGPVWLSDHRIFGTVVVSATALLEMTHAVARSAIGSATITVRDFSIQHALALPAATAHKVQTVASPRADGGWEVRIHGFAEGDWVVHAAGSAAIATEKALSAETSLADVLGRCRTAGDVGALYADYASRGLGYGPAFLAVKSLWIGANETLAEIELPSAAGDASSYGLHPVVLDACFQSAGAAFPKTDDVFLPVSVAQWTMSGAPGGRVWSHARVRSSGASATADLVIFASDGRVVGRLDGLALQRASAAALRRAVRTGGDWLYEITWPEVPPPAREAIAVTGDWLIATDVGGVGLKLAQELRVAGATVTCVAPEHIADTLAKRPVWRGVVHLSSLDVAGDVMPTFDGLGFESILALARTPVNLGAVWIVTTGAVAIGSGAVVRPGAAAAWGLGRVLAQEHPEWSLRLIDVEAASAASVLAIECQRSGAENQIALRSGKRHAARLTRLAPKENSVLKLQADAAYLITGGLGALGLLTAGWLLERGARHLVLVGRHEPGPDARAQIEAWIGAGVGVETKVVDVSDREQVRALLATLPTLRGIVHAAGAIADGAARQLTAEQFTRVLAPKVAGAWHLHQLAGELDFFVLFSSAAAVLGTPGQANYAAANAFLDGLAHVRRASGRPALSVNWGPWAAGMASSLGDRYAARGIGSIPPARGFEELERLLGAAAPQAVVLSVTWSRFFASLPAGQMPALLGTLAAGASTSAAGVTDTKDLKERLKGANAAGRAALLNGFVLAEVARVLGLTPDKLGALESLASLGLDSMMAVDLRNRMRLATGIDLPLVNFLESAAVATLVSALSDRLSASAATAAPAPLTAERAGELLARIDTLSESEVDALLAAENARPGP